jgi:pyruvate-ferredoxin/flavodoxin oxidoreductase
MIVANATGCSSIYGGSAPSFPWNVTDKGCGPAWANSLFEDNAEYGYGMHLASKSRREELKMIISEALKENIKNKDLHDLLQQWLQNAEEGDQTEELAEKIIPILEKEQRSPLLEKIYERKDILVKPSIWIIGGDGWAYDIGFGGLDHVIASGEDVNLLVLDTEVYSNTGGQASKSTPLSSIAKFAAMGKRTMKKDLGLMAMSYGNVYVASIAMGADKNQVVRAFKEAESYKGPSIVLAYSSCINHGIKEGMLKSQDQAKKAVEAGYWFNYRFDPRLKEQGKNPFQLDSKAPTGDLEAFLDGQVRYNYLKRTNPEEAKRLHEDLKKFLDQKYRFYKDLSEKQI